MRKFVKDLFWGPGNHYAELARFLVTLCIFAMFGACSWNAHLRQPIDLAALGGGLAAILTAGAGFLAAKAWARGKDDGS